MMRKLLLALTSQLLVGACVAAADPGNERPLDPSNIPVFDAESGRGELGYFVSIPDLYNAMSISRRDGAFFQHFYVSSPLQACERPEFSVCIFDDSLALIVRKGELKKGDQWAYGPFDFSVSDVFDPLAYVDVRSKNFDGDTLRLYVQDGAVLGFSWGVLLTGDCKQCFEERINYLWVSPSGRRFDNESLHR